MRRTIGLGLSALFAFFPPSYVSRSDNDWFDYMRLSCGQFLFTTAGPTWTSIDNMELPMGEDVETLASGTDIEKGSEFAGADLWQVLKDRCGPNMYRYAIYVSFTLSPKSLIAAELFKDSKIFAKTYEKRSDCENSRKEKFGVNLDFRKSYFCRVIARPTLTF